MRTVWLAFHGDYEQRSPFAAFSSEELAREHSDDVEGVDLFDRPVRTEAHWFRWVEVRAGVARDLFPPKEREWPEWLDSFGKPLSRAETLHYPADRSTDGEHTWIIVEGNDPKIVNAEVKRRLVEMGA